jgi:hypothetical protein
VQGEHGRLPARVRVISKSRCEDLGTRGISRGTGTASSETTTRRGHRAHRRAPAPAGGYDPRPTTGSGEHGARSTERLREKRKRGTPRASHANAKNQEIRTKNARATPRNAPVNRPGARGSWLDPSRVMAASRLLILMPCDHPKPLPLPLSGIWREGGAVTWQRRCFQRMEN